METKESNYDRLLIIDDNQAIHRDFEKIFAHSSVGSELDDLDAELFGTATENVERSPEFELDFESQGMAGFERLKESMSQGIVYGAAFVDMRMPPGWDGVETIENLWKVDPDLQVVICTAYSDRSWDEIFQKLGRTDKLLILKKPFDDIEVVQLAHSLSEKRRLVAMAQQKLDDLSSVVETQETELQSAHQNAEVLIGSMSSVLVSIETDGTVTRWNHIAKSVFGISAEQAVGKCFENVPIKWESWSTVETALQACSNAQGESVELRFVDESGITRILDAKICPILNGEASQGRLILANDVTVQTAMQTQLDQALRLESVGQLAAGVAHEINTPIQYIGDNVRFVSKSLGKLEPLLNHLHALADPDVTDQQLSEIRKVLPASPKASKVKNSLKEIPVALGDAIEGVASVAKIVAAMKEFSHPGSDVKSMVCVNHILESTITVAQNEWKYLAELETNFEDDLVKIDGLSSELNQAFLNIIVNASHAIGDRVEAGEFSKGLIQVATKSAGDHVEILIQDNGGGIPRHVQDKVFEPFFTTKDVGKGTGQGLAIAFGVITQKHQGSLSFTVEEGVGTKFCIKLPKESISSSTEQHETSELEQVEVAI